MFNYTAHGAREQNNCDCPDLDVGLVPLNNDVNHRDLRLGPKHPGERNDLSPDLFCLWYIHKYAYHTHFK